MTALSVSGSFSVEVQPAAVERRDKLLAGAAFITVVDNSADQEVAVRLLKDLKEHLKGVESTRKQVKEPIIAAGKKVDGMASDHIAPLEAAFNRVSSLVAGFQARERARVAEEEHLRQMEVSRLEDERRAAIIAAQKAAGSMQTEADLAVALAAEKAAQEARSAADIAIRAPLPEAIREPGMIVRKKLDFVVTDIHALYKAAPHLCRIEANRSVILSLCTVNTVIPGIKFTEELVTTVRT